MKMKTSLVLLLLPVVCIAKGYDPKHIHAGLGSDATELSIGWSTFANTSQVPYFGNCTSDGCGESWVNWGVSPDQLPEYSQGDKQLFVCDAGNSNCNPSHPDQCGRKYMNHAASMMNLKPNTIYHYRVGGNTTGWSKVYQIRTSRDVTAGGIQKHIVFGDLGAWCGFSLGPNCTCEPDDQCTSKNTSFGLISEALSGDIDMALQVGDFAYDLQTANGFVGDLYFQTIEPISTIIPLMVSQGNHEMAGTNLARYTTSFRNMPSNDVFKGNNTVITKNDFSSRNNWYFSWNEGLVHYVALSTELFFTFPKERSGGRNITWDGASLVTMFEWLEQDLSLANKNRHSQPWIIVHGHRSVYCSCDGDCDSNAEQIRDGPFKNGTYGLEDLFFRHGVDLYLNGHEHNYERNWPTYKGFAQQSNTNPNATIYIVTGAAGNGEMHEPFELPQPPRSAVRSNVFGYSKLTIFNSSHIYFEQIATDPALFSGHGYGDILDATWVIQSNHGPFNPSYAPSTVGDPIGRSIDHWDSLKQNGVAYDKLLDGLKFKGDQNGTRLKRYVEQGIFSKYGGRQVSWEGATGLTD
eukprot:TRINITY_DN22020_c0_g1_i1.p1 TRINITY_DN22020_c0_g1~~TRINITY_DN22020_c0_g1_i1.p1  ORF type:complete len:577 (+),score=70.65 TRINITY_DN22020_c0_g1_i1:139-1869(+)